MIFINKMDRPGADYFRVIKQIKERLGANPIPVQIPIMKDDDFLGVIDLIKMKSIFWDDDGKGSIYRYESIPDELQDPANYWREILIETAAESNEELLESYLEEGSLSEENIISGLRALSISNEIVVTMCGSAFKN
jgi:elongation factor G